MRRKAFAALCLSISVLSARAEARVVLACVDCYGSAALYPVVAGELFREYDVHLIHVRTEKFLSRGQRRDIEATRGLYRDYLDVDMDDADSVEKALAFLRAAGVRRVIGGMETGAFQSDLLNHHLGLPGNSPFTRDLRRAKAPMAKALGDLGIPTILSDDLDAIERFVASQTSEFVVVKPNRSSGSEGLEFIRRNDLPRLRKVLGEMLTQTDKYGHPMNAVVQPAIVGHEYVANTFRDGEHTLLLGAWRYLKVRAPGSRKLVYFVDRPVDPHSVLGRELATLAPVIHRRLGNHIGPGHAELLHEQGTRRWYVIEQAARVAGTGVPAVEAALWGTSHLHLNLAFSIGPDAFAKELAKWTGTRKTDAAIMNFISLTSGKLRPSGVELLETLGSYFRPFETFRPVPDSPVVETIDLQTSPFVAAFTGADGAVLRDVDDMVRAQVDGRLFDFGPAPCPKALGRMGELETALLEARRLHF